VTLDAIRFEGHDCVRLEGETTDVVVAVSAGPRILGLIGSGGNLMAILPDGGIDRPGGDRFRFRGGHRLWAAPEVAEITYQPDDLPCAVDEIDDGVRVEAPADGAGLVKSIEVQRSGGGWIVDHEIRNDSGAHVTFAPWAITQLRTGGEAIMPASTDVGGVQADRCLVLWPYTDPGDPRIRFGANDVRIDARPGGAPLKLGVAPGRGHVSYRLGAETFEKRVDVEPDAVYADRGAAIQVYLAPDFCELETLGPLRTVSPGDATTHRESWTVRRTEASPR
jgi:hypothetical protein